MIVGNVGIAPGSAITGFNPFSGVAVPDPQVTGGLVHATTAVAVQAQSDLAIARTNLALMGANMPIVEFLQKFAKSKNATPSQISLAWLLAQKPWIVPIPGTRNIDHLNENLGALHVVLTSADLVEIDSALSKIKVHGGRMNSDQMKIVEPRI